MNTKKYHLENYGKFLLNRVTNCAQVIGYIETCLSTEDEAAFHSFHKIMVHNWKGDDGDLFYSLGNYYTVQFVPIHTATEGSATTFYTSNLNLVLRMCKLDFLFPHHWVMYNIDILFNDKTSADLFENRLTVKDIITSVVSNRFNEKCELNLSNLHNDPEFIEKKIQFYRVGLLNQYKILMLRIGKDTKALNLSNNNLSQIPMELMNFFIKADLTSVNLSHNNIGSIKDLQRLSSKIEKLWIEGNPLCKDIEPIAYVKSVVSKFPKLTELDGIKLSNHVGIMLPFFKNFSESADPMTKSVVEMFLTNYFTHYDTMPRRLIDRFYDLQAKLSLTTSFTAIEEAKLPHYAMFSNNILDVIRGSISESSTRTYVGRDEVVDILSQFPETVHDPSTFTVDILKHDQNSLIIIIDGNYKEKVYRSSHQYFRFRRTFVFNVKTKNDQREYHITNEMFTVTAATLEHLENSYLTDEEVGTGALTLKKPDKASVEVMCNIFCHLTQLKREEALLRLKIYCWDLTKALQEFVLNTKINNISMDRFQEDEDFTDGSSILDEVD